MFDKLPFSEYDFFGYLASGFLLLVAVAVHWPMPPLPFASEAGLAAIVLVLSYMAGHVVATVSSAILEAGVVSKLLGDPVHNLLGEPVPRTVRGLFPGYSEPLPVVSRGRVKKKLTELTIPATLEEVATHGFPLAGAIPAVAARMATFLNLYGFARNATVTLAACGLLLFGSDLPRAHYFALALILLAVGMLYRYLKFYRLYFRELLLSAYDT